MKQLYIFTFCVCSFFANAQVTQVLDINDGSSNSNPAGMIVFNGNFYFAADDGSGVNSGGIDYGKELWVSDGTAANTDFIIDIRMGTASGTPTAFFVYNGALYFSAFDGTSSDLWTSDGTAMGTTKVDLFPGVNEAVQRPIELGGVVYMTGISSPGDTNDLIVFDGSTGANVPNADPDVNADENILNTMAALNGKLYMYMSYASDDATTGSELYEYDPATDLFSLIKDIDVGAGDSSISWLTTLGTKIYFEAENELWETDGTNAGTQQVAVATSIGNPLNLYAWNGKLFFEGDDGTGDQLWVYDPVADTVTNLSNISGGSNTNHDPADFVEYNGFLYYRGEDTNDTQGHLFRTNGTVVEQLDSTIKDVDDLVVYNNRIYFEGDDDTTGNELFTFDPATLSVGSVENNTIAIYPNPSKNYINVAGITETLSYTIHDLNGRTLQSGEMLNNTIEHRLAKGLYILELKGENISTTKKIIVD
ncbi:MAG: T9SS type A sorting domain-containing protein [Bacteroidota bacterium]